MNIPLKPLKYTVAIGNLLHLILWTFLEAWILAGLVIALFYHRKTNVWVYVECSPIALYIMLLKFFGFYGAYTKNHIFIVIHIMLSTVYILSIALSIIHLTLFGEDSIRRPYVWQQLLSVLYHLTNFILLILSVVLFFLLRAIRTTLSSYRTEQSASVKDPNEQDQTNGTKEPENPLFKRLVPENDNNKK